MSKLIRDTWLLFVANLRTSLRNPVWVIMGLFQPICYLLLFAPLLEGLAGGPGFERGRAFDTFAPGLLIIMALFSTGYVGFGLIANMRAGVIERLRVTPVSRLSLLLGMVVRDVVVLLVQCTLLMTLAIMRGLRPDLLGLMLTYVLLVLLAVMMASCSYAVALLVKHEGALASSVNFVMVPLMLLSGFTLPLSLAPPVLRWIGSFNPLAHAVDTSRALINARWHDRDAFLGFVIFIPLASLAAFWATRSMRRATM
jgi:ABC-2 type transport system permease protein